MTPSPGTASNSATYWADLDLPFSIVSVFVAKNEAVAERYSQILGSNSVIFTLAEWNTVEDYLHEKLDDEDIQEAFLDPGSWRYPDCLSVAFMLKILLEKAQAISDDGPFDPDLLARLNEQFKEEVEALEIAHAD